MNTNELLIHTLIDHQLTIASAESCTGGLFSSTLTDVSGSSEAVNGAVVSYVNDVKMNILGVKKETIDTVTEVSYECAREMALGVRTSFKSSIGVSFTGFAGPTGGNGKDAVGTVYIGLSTKDLLESYRFHFEGSRLEVKKAAVDKAMSLILEAISSGKLN